MAKIEYGNFSTSMAMGIMETLTHSSLERNMAVRLRRQKIYGLVLVSGLTVLSVYFYLVSVDQNCKRTECRKRYV